MCDSLFGLKQRPTLAKPMLGTNRSSSASDSAFSQSSRAASPPSSNSRSSISAFALRHGALCFAAFPYAVFFAADQDHVVILAAMHMARDPAAWQERVDRDV